MAKKRKFTVRIFNTNDFKDVLKISDDKLKHAERVLNTGKLFLNDNCDIMTDKDRISLRYIEKDRGNISDLLHFWNSSIKLEQNNYIKGLYLIKIGK